MNAAPSPSARGPRASTKGQGFSRDERVRQQRDFDRVHRGNAYAADAVLVVRVAANGLQHARLGLSVSRKVGSAVVRNHWKRLIRESFRLSKDQLPAGVDIVVRPRRGAVAEFHAVRRSLPGLCRRAARRIKSNS